MSGPAASRRKRDDFLFRFPLKVVSRLLVLCYNTVLSLSLTYLHWVFETSTNLSKCVTYHVGHKISLSPTMFSLSDEPQLFIQVAVECGPNSQIERSDSSGCHTLALGLNS